MRLRWHLAQPDHDDAERTSDDGGGAGAEYVDCGAARIGSEEDDRADRAAWYRARHYTAGEP